MHVKSRMLSPFPIRLDFNPKFDFFPSHRVFYSFYCGTRLILMCSNLIRRQFAPISFTLIPQFLHSMALFALTLLLFSKFADSRYLKAESITDARDTFPIRSDAIPSYNTTTSYVDTKDEDAKPSDDINVNNAPPSVNPHTIEMNSTTSNMTTVPFPDGDTPPTEPVSKPSAPPLPVQPNPVVTKPIIKVYPADRPFGVCPVIASFQHEKDDIPLAEKKAQIKDELMTSFILAHPSLTLWEYFKLENKKDIDNFGLLPVHEQRKVCPLTCAITIVLQSHSICVANDCRSLGFRYKYRHRYRQIRCCCFHLDRQNVSTSGRWVPRNSRFLYGI